ncbi:restriction endonuclease subunit S [Vibrio alginolyticus]|uniref:restriction endonuclease subunit S n=1 Tax=Vibrio alginolyticus TaxID=663 RepID=UPI001BD58A42|nr:restriction endonuclease subunit S [Vibrio alginolyticus]MBT0108729.1 restriction endonuclease subunit S [Vibrio alginolyticus]HDU8577886.1 restriction endonuclease subunit S [Vibrio diabolicus]
MSELPKGWVLSSIGEGCLIENGLRKPISLKERANCQGSYPYYGATGVIDYLDSYTHEGEYVLIGEDGANLLSKSKPLAFIADGKYWVNNHAHTLKSLAGTPNQYLEKYFNSLSLEQWVTGSAQPKLTKKNLESIPYPLAPLPEQKRIVEKLDEVLVQVDTIKARLDGIPELLKRFRQSVLASAVSGKLTEDWRGITMIDGPIQKNLGDVITKIGQGWSPKCESTPAENGEWGVIKTSSVQNISFIEHENKALPKSLEARPEHELLAGDILTTRAGPRVRCGITAYVDTTRPNLMICDKVYRYQVKESEGFSKYLAYLLNAPQYLAEIEKMKTGISDSGMNLTQSKFKQLPLFWPHIEEQKEIVRLVDKYFVFANTIETQVKKAQARVDNLTQSILAKAFRGELVPQNDDDEPAEVLLERIAQARKEAEELAKAAKKVAKAKRQK